ncbi:MAG: DUF1684 domain-containing protein [Lysobacteraceae bacterium]
MRTIQFTAIIAALSLTLAGCDRAPSVATDTPAATPLPAAITAAPTEPSDSTADEMQDITQWREKRVTSLQKPNGWLTLVGLHWVEPGAHTVGSAGDNDIQLATGPAHLGKLTLKDGKATLVPDAAAQLMIDDKPASGAVVLQPDSSEQPTQVAFNNGDAGFTLIERSGRFALRVKDAQAPTRTGFKGIDYFDIDPSWRFNARFEPHPPGQTIKIASVINTIEPMANPGAVVFEKDGKTYRLEAVDEGDGELFLIFADRTNNKTTYGAGRFLYADAPKDGMTVVDFNKAYNPPCVFTHYATCPLPPPENRLDLTINAGEKKYSGAVEHEASPAVARQ